MSSCFNFGLADGGVKFPLYVGVVRQSNSMPFDASQQLPRPRPNRRYGVVRQEKSGVFLRACLGGQGQSVMQWRPTARSPPLARGVESLAESLRSEREDL